MITHTTGDIFRANVEALVNPVNCVGVAGRGLALEFRKRFPENFAFYQKACCEGEIAPGRVHLVARPFPPVPRTAHWPKRIVNFPTKRHWRDTSRLEDIEAGLLDLTAAVRSWGIRSIAIPALGCGLGGLDWSDVRPRIELAFVNAGLSAVDVRLYGPREENS